MKLLIITLALAAACVAQKRYTNKYDNMDLDEVLANRRLLVSYIKCVLDQGRCTAEGKELKTHISDALQTGCKKCTPNQREGARRVISHMIKEEPEYWTMLVEKYDPERMYSTKYEKEINSIQ
ncbi:allergen Tha p 1 [Plutella xylostella]|uniref:allergen Tha p 1 n=1 Tax=Plutella xylostella TaxID=51655 RepID=UPI0020328580|nr:allergen Tha p 1 [Plutella xylostella]